MSAVAAFPFIVSAGCFALAVVEYRWKMSGWWKISFILGLINVGLAVTLWPAS